MKKIRNCFINYLSVFSFSFALFCFIPFLSFSFIFLTLDIVSCLPLNVFFPKKTYNKTYKTIKLTKSHPVRPVHSQKPTQLYLFVYFHNESKVAGGLLIKYSRLLCATLLSAPQQGVSQGLYILNSTPRKMKQLVKNKAVYRF